MAVGPGFVTQPNPTNHSLNPTHRQLNIPDPTQPNPSMKNIPFADDNTTKPA